MSEQTKFYCKLSSDNNVYHKLLKTGVVQSIFFSKEANKQ